MKVLVTGAHGFVGRYLVKQLLEDGHEVLAVSNSNCEPIRNFLLDTSFDPDKLSKILEESSLKKNFDEDFIDLTSPNLATNLVVTYKPQIIFHLAAQSFVPACEANFSEALLVNVGITDALISALCNLSYQSRFIFISTGDIYGNVKEEELPITEDSIPSPLNRYAVTKLCAETVVSSWGRRSPNVTTAIMRPFNHIGPFQHERFVVSKITKAIALALDGNGSREIILGNIDAQRDFTDVRDVVRAYTAVGYAFQEVGIFLVGSGNPISIKSLAEQAMHVAGIKIKMSVDDSLLRSHEQTEKKVLGVVSPLIANFNRIRRIGWSPKITLEQSLSDMIRFWRNKGCSDFT